MTSNRARHELIQLPTIFKVRPLLGTRRQSGTVPGTVTVPDSTGRGRGRSPVPVPDLSGIGDSPPSPSPIWRGRGRSPIPDSDRGVRAPGLHQSPCRCGSSHLVAPVHLRLPGLIPAGTRPGDRADSLRAQRARDRRPRTRLTRNSESESPPDIGWRRVLARTDGTLGTSPRLGRPVP